jgi:hypothetical protein
MSGWYESLLESFMPAAAPGMMKMGRDMGTRSVSHGTRGQRRVRGRRTLASVNPFWSLARMSIRTRGKKRALVAVGHSLLVIIYHVLKNRVEYQDLGPDYFERLEPERLQPHLVRRLQRLGYDVTLTPRVVQDSVN